MAAYELEVRIDLCAYARRTVEADSPAEAVAKAKTLIAQQDLSGTYEVSWAHAGDPELTSVVNTETGEECLTHADDAHPSIEESTNA